MKDIRRKFRSRSQLYEALSEYLRELENEVEKTRVVSVQQKAELQEICSQLELLANEKDDLENDVEALRVEARELGGEVERLNRERDDLKIEVTEIEARGFTKEIMTKLKIAYDRKGAEVDAFLEDLEEASKLRDDVNQLKKSKTALARVVGSSQSRKQKIAKELVSEKTRLDLVKVELATFREVADVLTEALKEGYAAEQFKTMLLLLREREISGEPLRSISILLDCIQEAQNLSNLKQAVSRADKRLNELLKAEKEVNDRIKVAQEAVLKEIEEVKIGGERAITWVGEQARDYIGKVVSMFYAAMKDAVDKANADLAEKKLELGKLQHQKETLEHLIAPAIILNQLLSSPEKLKVHPSLVAQLLEGMSVWCEKKFPKAIAGARYDVVAKEFALDPASLYAIKISSLMMLAAEYIKKRVAEERWTPMSSEGGF